MLLKGSKLNQSGWGTIIEDRATKYINHQRIRKNQKLWSNPPKAPNYNIPPKIRKDFQAGWHQIYQTRNCIEKSFRKLLIPSEPQTWSNARFILLMSQAFWACNHIQTRPCFDVCCHSSNLRDYWFYTRLTKLTESIRTQPKRLLWCHA